MTEYWLHRFDDGARVISSPDIVTPLVVAALDRWRSVPAWRKLSENAVQEAIAQCIAQAVDDLFEGETLHPTE